MKKSKNSMPTLLKLIQVALLSAIIVIMAYTPLGFLKVGLVEITFITIPVIVGAIVIGPGAGAFLGTLFGALSFAQCFGMSAFGAGMLGISPLRAFLVCVPTRLIMGLLCGLIYKTFKKGKSNLPAISVSSLCGALLNTILFVGTFILLYSNTDFFKEMAQGKNLVAFVGMFVGLNGLIEAIACFVIASAVCKALLLLNNRMIHHSN